MSGVFKAIGKVFKKVVKVVKKIAIPALAIGAVVLTGGAALGVLPSVASVIGGLGLPAGISTMLSSAVTSSGLGFLMGGKKGAVSGFVTGGLMGALGAPIGGTPSGGVGSTLPNSSQLINNVAAQQAPASIAGAASAAPAVAAVAPNVTASISGLPTANGGLMGTIFGNQQSPVAGQLLQGLGQGLMAKAQYKAEERARAKEEERIAGNYSTEGGLLDPSVMNGSAAAPRFDDPYAEVAKWSYDPRQGKLVRKEG